MGAEVLLSCHPGIPMNAGQIVDLALFLEKRSPDIIKIVTIANTEDEAIMYILGSHLVDLIVYIMDEPKKITPFLKRTKLDGVDFEDNTLAILEYEKALCRIFVSSVEVNGFGRRQFMVSGSLSTVNICPLERPITMTYSDTKIADKTHEDRKIILPFEDNTAEGRYDDMMRDFYSYILGEKTNPFSYEHDYIVQKVLSEIVGGVRFNGTDID